MIFTDLPEEEQDKYRDLVAEVVSDLWHCSRVWEAWYVGTMTEEDFSPTIEDEDWLYEQAEIIYEFSQKGESHGIQEG